MISDSTGADISARLGEVLKHYFVNQELEALGQDRSKPEWVFCSEAGARLDPDHGSSTSS